MVKANAVVVLAGLFGAGALVAVAEPPPSIPAASATWTQIYEDSETIYYVKATALVPADVSETESLLEFKIPQVVGGVQVWSMVSRMRLNCDRRQVVTIDNTSYALQMGAGRVIQSRPANDTWHEPEVGSLGELIWSTACGKK